MEEEKNYNFDIRHNFKFSKPVYGVFCYGIPYECNEEEISKIFAESGKIVFVWLMLKRDGSRNGNGIIFYSSQYEMQDAIKRFDNFSYKNRVLRVQEYKPRERQSDRNTDEYRRKRAEY